MIKIEELTRPASVISSFGSCPLSSVNISTDTRAIEKDDCFVALYGPNFDGRNFLDQAISSGASVVVYEENESCEGESFYEKYSDKTILVITVKNIFDYISELATLRITSWKKSGGVVLGLTGTNGKTTCKEMLHFLLEEVSPGDVIATKGNLNNHIGVPLTIFRLEDKYKYLVLEMGTNHPGEIEYLCSIGLPDYGYISSIGDGHLEFFKTRENVFHEKSMLYNQINNTNSEGFFLVNTHDPFLKELNGKNKCKPVLDMGVRNSHILGKHNFENLNAMAYFVSLLFPGEEMKQKILSKALEFQPTKNRSSWVEANGVRFFLDAYNANPSSMRLSLESYIDYCETNKISTGHYLVILGDMNELGEAAAATHQEIGEILKKRGVDNVAFIGRYSAEYQSGFQGKGLEFKSVEDFATHFKKVRTEFENIFIKGSRSLQLESILDIT
jgi:UDP-N-acetylmuramoyl-tripeptide--D-alanyl-D-alanine ligase